MPNLNDCPKCGKRHYAGSKNAQKCRTTGVGNLSKMSAPGLPAKPAAFGGEFKSQIQQMSTVLYQKGTQVLNELDALERKGLRTDHYNLPLRDTREHAVFLATAQNDLAEIIMGLEERGKLLAADLDVLTSPNPKTHSVLSTYQHLMALGDKEARREERHFYHNAANLLSDVYAARIGLREISLKLNLGDNDWDDDTRQKISAVMDTSAPLWK